MTKRTFAPRTCPECGDSYEPRHVKQVFCSPAHQTAFHNRSMKRGKELVPLLLAARRSRGTSAVSKAAFSAWVQLVDKFNREDREAGRPDPELYAATRGWPTSDGFVIAVNVEDSKRRPRKAA